MAKFYIPRGTTTFTVPSGGTYTSVNGVITITNSNDIAYANQVGLIHYTGSPLASPGNRQRTLAVLGDSFGVRDTWSTTGPNWYGWTDPTSLFNWTNVLLGQRFNAIYFDGVSGTTYPQWDNGVRVENALASGADYLWLTGDGDGGDTTSTAATYIAALTSIFTKCHNAGVIPIMHTIPPENSLTTAATRLRTQLVNQWLTYTAPQLFPSLIVMPIGGAWLLAGSLTYQPDTNLNDGTHAYLPGAFNVAQLCAAILDPLIPKWTPPWLDMYDASSGGITSVIQSPIMVGTGGGVSVLTSAGIPNGWTASATGTAPADTGTANTSARTDLKPGNWLDYAVTFGAADHDAQAYFNGTSQGMGGKNIGDNVQFFAEMKIDPATAARVKGIYLFAEFVNAGTKYAAALFTGAMPTQGLGAANWSARSASDIYVLGTPAMAIPPGTTGFRITAGLRSLGAGACNFSVGRVAMV